MIELAIAMLSGVCGWSMADTLDRCSSMGYPTSYNDNSTERQDMNRNRFRYRPQSSWIRREHRPRQVASKILIHEGANLGESLTPWLQMCVPQRPGMNHVWPHLEGHGHIGGSCGGRKAYGIRKQGFI
jgi:hypothetical protein